MVVAAVVAVTVVVVVVVKMLGWDASVINMVVVDEVLVIGVPVGVVIDT